jgi:hypothetical protein
MISSNRSRPGASFAPLPASWKPDCGLLLMTTLSLRCRAGASFGFVGDAGIYPFAGVSHTPVLAKDGGCQTIDMTHVVVETESLEADSKSIKLKTNSQVLS